MAVIVIGDSDRAALACNTSNQAFGPVHRSVDGDAERELREFLNQLEDDARRIEVSDLHERYHAWREAREDTADTEGVA